MSVATARGASVWIETGPEQPSHRPLDEHVHADVVVIGGGMVGITTALLLTESGADVVLLEANQLARGVSGYTTAKVSSQHGLIYDTLRSTFGTEGARTYGQANEAALAWIANRVERDGIDCDFRRQSSYAYASSESKRPQIEDEVDGLSRGAAGNARRDTSLRIQSRRRPSTIADFTCQDLLALRSGCESGCWCTRIRTRRGGLRRDCVVKTQAVCGRQGRRGHHTRPARSLAFARVHTRARARLSHRGSPPPALLSGDSPTLGRAVRDGDESVVGCGSQTAPLATPRAYCASKRFARDHGRASLEYLCPQTHTMTGAYGTVTPGAVS